MFSEFSTWLQIGFTHIFDFKAYDHMLFVAVLCGVYPASEWRKLLILVTAFTIGHSSSLLIAVSQAMPLASDWIEFLIPVTILCTGIANFTESYQNTSSKVQMSFRYFFAAIFGVVHGLGFANSIQNMFSEIHSVWFPLLAFNLGIELGQLLILAGLLGASALAFDFLKVRQRDWNLVLSSVVIGICLPLIQKTWLF